CTIFIFFLYLIVLFFILFFFTDPPPTEIYTLSLHDALPILLRRHRFGGRDRRRPGGLARTVVAEDLFHEQHRPEEHPAEDHQARSEEHTSELQSQSNLVCRLLLEKKKKKNKNKTKHENNQLM